MTLRYFLSCLLPFIRLLKLLLLKLATAFKKIKSSPKSENILISPIHYKADASSSSPFMNNELC